MKMICMAVMLFITLLSAGAQKNIPASDIKVAMMKATRFMVEKVSMFKHRQSSRFCF